jgi:predicted permease
MRKDRKQALPIEPDAESAADLEIQNHIAEAMERLVSEGMSEEDARAEALRRFGSVRHVRGTMVRETRSVERRATLFDFLSSIPADARYAWRGLINNRLFMLIVIGTLGLGMGAAATGFTVVDALLLRPLPYADPDALVDVDVMDTDGNAMPVLTVDRVKTLKADGRPFEAIAFTDQRSYTLTGDGSAQTVGALAVTAGIDELLGMHPYIGRAFTAEDMKPGTKRVMMTYDFWRQHGSRRDVAGSTVHLDGQPYEVIGVIPRNFKYPVAGSGRAFWVAMTSDFTNNGAPIGYVSGVARLAPGVTVEAANALLSSIPSLSVDGAPPKGMAAMKLHASSIARWRGNRELVRGVWLVMGAILLMLLVAMVNATNLILFRGADRTRELAVRLALGVSRAQLLRHILVENIVIALLSGVAAVVVTIAGVHAVNDRLPREFAFSSAYTFAVSTRVLGFAFLLACIVGLVLGILPGIRSLRMKFTAGELTSSRGATRADTRISQGLVVAEVALAVTLLAGAGLLANSFARLTHVDPGLDTDHLAFMTLSLPDSRYTSPQASAAFFNQLEARLEADPAISAATVSGGAPPSVSFSFGVELQAENGQPLPVPKDDPGLLPFISGAPDFVKTTGMQIVAGRDITDADAGTDNVLIDSNLARALWGSDVAGRRFRTGPDDAWMTAVGVYRHLRAMGLDDRTAPYGYIRARNRMKARNYMSVIARTRGNPSDAIPAIRDAVRSLDPDVPINDLQTARDAYSDSVDKPRFLARVMTGISAVALLLAAVGVYGVLSYSVTRRRREMGIRMALGAPPMGLGWLFLREGLIMTIAGLAVGLVAGLWLVRFARALLFALEPSDPATFSAVAVIVLITAVIASMIPARVAGRMSPAEVLRTE